MAGGFKAGAGANVSRIGGGVKGSTPAGSSGAEAGGSIPCSLTSAGAGTADGSFGKLSVEEGFKFGTVPAFMGASFSVVRCGVTRPTGAADGAGASVSSPLLAFTTEGRGAEEAPAPAKGATQLTALPPFVPEQLHVQGPLPLTALAIPAEQSPLRGIVSVVTPCAEPHSPTTGGGGIKGAVQLTVMPPFWPRQPQFHGPEPLTLVATPAEQSPSVGSAIIAAPLAEPQLPFTSGPGGGGALGTTLDVEQVPAMPPFRPEQVHVHGPSP
jgi:hypothetical protein